MAYVDQAKKARIKAALIPAMPRDWKWSLSVRHHSTIVLTIQAAPVALLEIYTRTHCAPELREAVLSGKEQNLSMNPYHWREHFEGNELGPVFEKIFAAMNLDNHDRSDLQSDYFDVGHYVEVNFGRWDKPFVNTAASEAQAATA